MFNKICLIVSAAAASIVSTSARGSSHDYIVHGVAVAAADPIAATTVAVINEDRGGIALCTGSLVAEDLVVTAAHCVGPDASRMRLAFKRDLLHTAAGQVSEVTGFARPKDYGHIASDEDMNDIALVHFEGGLPAGYQVAHLLDDSSALKNGETVTLAGFGVSDGEPQTDGGNAGAGVLRKVNVKIARASFGKTEVAMDQSHGKGACHGDSGGPAFLKVGNEYRLFGVTSRGISDGPDDCSNTSIYTNILAHQAFLKTAAASLRKHGTRH